jgi:predicted flap endonuclease-1-like 5' DNA nuclease
MVTLATIEGVGDKHAATMAKHGVRTTQALLRAGGSKKGRSALASDSGVSEKLILGWVNRADLMRVRGVGEEYSDLLEQAGVDTVKELRTRKPANLHAKMLDVNGARKVAFVRRPPSLGEVERWVAHAAELEPAVTY